MIALHRPMLKFPFHWDELGQFAPASLDLYQDGSLVAQSGSEFSIDVDLVVLAIGQATHTGFLADAGLQVERGRIVIDRVTGQTSNPKYFAGGDCTNGGREVVDAVADGKRAGLGIGAWLASATEANYANA